MTAFVAALGAALGMLAALTPPAPAHAHALEPAYLELTPIGGEAWRVFWRRPDVQGRPMRIDVRLPAGCEPASAPDPSFDGRAWVATWAATCADGLTGGEIAIPGLTSTRTDVLVRYETEAGDTRTVRLTPDSPAFAVARDPGATDVLRTYMPLGIGHILGGLDHLLFVLALLLLIPDRWRLVGAITAFTVAHSITMAAATLGWVTLPGPPVEAVIALSIMFVAAELTLRDGSGDRLSQRRPWLVSFAFGLLHGFGFAGALRQIGLPQSDVPLALFSFNLGVEIGQLLFVGAVLLAALGMRVVAPRALQAFRSPRSDASLACAYLIGSIAAFWFIERIAAFRA